MTRIRGTDVPIDVYMDIVFFSNEIRQRRRTDTALGARSGAELISARCETVSLLRRGPDESQVNNSVDQGITI